MCSTHHLYIFHVFQFKRPKIDNPLSLCVQGEFWLPGLKWDLSVEKVQNRQNSIGTQGEKKYHKFVLILVGVLAHVPKETGKSKEISRNLIYQYGIP